MKSKVAVESEPTAAGLGSFPDRATFTGKQVFKMRRDAMAAWESALLEAKTISERVKDLLGTQPYQLRVRVSKASGGRPATMHVLWSRGGRSVVWYDIQHDSGLTGPIRDLLGHYNLQLEELMSVQMVARSTIMAAERLLQVQRGENYNRLSKGPGAGLKRSAAVSRKLE